jgi:hypothetical protein
MQDTSHRVYCRRSDTPRLAYRRGVLFWLVSDEPTRKGTMTGIDLVREVLGPDTPVKEADFILWELTSFPFVASGRARKGCTR